MYLSGHEPLWTRAVSIKCMKCRTQPQWAWGQERGPITAEELHSMQLKPVRSEGNSLEEVYTVTIILKLVG